MLAAVAVIIAIMAVAMFFRGSDAFATAKQPFVHKIQVDSSYCKGGSGDGGANVNCYAEYRCENPCYTSETECTGTDWKFVGYTTDPN